MNQVFIAILILFTSGPTASVTQRVDTLEDCTAVVDAAPSMIGQKIPGPDGEKITVVDAQGKCIIITQQKQASK